jgi:hypothetical protein
MQEEQLSKEKSLEIIQQMINQAKSNISDNGLGWLLWGSMIIAAAVSTYVFIEIDADQIFLGWNIFGIVTIVLLLWDVFKPRRKKVRTYIDDLLRLADLGFIISLFTIIFAINVAVHPNAGFGFFMMIFGMFMLIKGGAVKSKSLMAGAAVNWTGAFAMFLNKDFKYDMLIMAAAVLIGYIIPGMILWQQYRKSTRQLQ